MLSLLAAAPASAQSTRRPDLNPFGRGFRDASQSLSVTGNLGTTFYDVIQGRTVRPDSQDIPDHGWGTFGTAALNYRLNVGSVRFEGSAGLFARYYPGLDDTLRVQFLPDGGAGLSWGWDLSDRTKLQVGSGLRYRSLYAEALDTGGFGRPGAGGGLGTGVGQSDMTSAFLPPDSAFAGGRYLASNSDASLRHQLSRRWSATADYGYRRDFVFEEADDLDPMTLIGRRDGWSQMGGTALHFALTRNLSVRGGYRYLESRFGEDDRPFRSHTADVGVDYGDSASLQLTRRTSLSFGGGLSGFVDRQARQRYELTGNVALMHEIGRTWSSRLAYDRGLSTNELLFQEPVLRDTVTASLNGLLSRRVGFHAMGGASHGAVGLLDGDDSHVSIMASSGVQAALSQQIAVTAAYSYYHYRFGGGVVRPRGLSDRSASQGVHVYLSLWAPIFQTRGRPNAAR